MKMQRELLLAANAPGNPLRHRGDHHLDYLAARVQWLKQQQKGHLLVQAALCGVIQLASHLVIVYDVQDFSKGGEIRCQVADCNCHRTLSFDFRKK